MQSDVDPDEVEQFFADLPKVIPALRRGRNINRALIAFIIGASLLFGWSFDRAADRDRRNALETCRAVNKNAQGINRAVDTAIDSIRMNDAYSAAERRARIASWERVRQTIPICEPQEKP